MLDLVRRRYAPRVNMHRQGLLSKLEAYVPSTEPEALSRDRIIAFVRVHPDCFERSLRVGHVTGSAWLLDPTGEKVLLTRHRKLGKWLQLGGHADGNPDVLEVALREAREESGIADIVPISKKTFDVDVHRIPARGGEPEHDHYDIRFLLRVSGDATFRVSDESDDLAWVSKSELPTLESDESVLRMHRKWQKLDVVWPQLRDVGL